MRAAPGMVHPYDQEGYYRGIRMVRYDLVKELVVATVILGLVALVLAIVLSSPDVPPATIQGWAQSDPVDFTTTAANELAGSTASAQYGPPYNGGSNSTQSIGPFSPQKWAGVQHPVDSAQDYVIGPLQHASMGDSQLAAALSMYQSASSDQQGTWLTAYTKALSKASVDNGTVVVASGDYGPVPMLLNRLLQVARSGGLDGLLLINGKFYQTDYTTPLLFLNDGGFLPGLAQQQNLQGNQWGMMNETGSYPGQAWLWLYTFWYQIPPFSTAWASFADLAVILLMGLLTLLLMLVPFIPGLRDIPRWIPVHRIVWRKYYASSQVVAKA